MNKGMYRLFFSGLILSVVMFSETGCRKDNCKKGIEEKLYVANEEDGTVSVIDAKTFEVLETVDLTFRNEMYMPHNVQVAPDNKSVWVTCVPMQEGQGELVVVLKGKRDKDCEHIKVGSEQHLAHVVLDDGSKYAYASANEAGQIIKIDAKKNKEVQRFDLGSGSGPHGMRYMDGKLYVACMYSSELIIVDVSSGALTHVPVGGIAVQTAVLPGIGSVFVSVYNLKKVVRYDLASGDTINIMLPSEAQGPIQLYPSPDNKRVYVCDQGIVNGNPPSDKLYVIDTDSNAVVATVIVGKGAHGVTTNTDGTKIFVSNLKDNSVAVIDAASLSVIHTIPVGHSPNGVSVLNCED